MTAPAPEARASTPDDDARRDALAGRLFEALLGTFDLLVGPARHRARALRGPARPRARDAARSSRPAPGSTPGMPASGSSSRR